VRIPFTTPPAWPERRAGSFALENVQFEPEGAQVALLGLSDDAGVRLNGGRPGAAAGPAAFRAALARFGTPWDGRAGKAITPRVFDAGDLVPAEGGSAEALVETHRRALECVRALHDLGAVVVAVGGGHDLTLPAVTALALREGRALGGVNVDAHLDVRARIGSGMPFRRLIEGGHLAGERFVEVGLGRFVNDQSDTAWALAQGAHLLYADELPERQALVPSVFDAAFAAGTGFVSIDLDAIDQAFAPGVSAPNPHGIDVALAARFAEAAGRDPQVRHFDLMELCPAHDEGGRTARVAAYLFMSFVAGLTERPR